MAVQPETWPSPIRVTMPNSVALGQTKRA